jgi:hypothetical protein
MKQQREPGDACGKPELQAREEQSAAVAVVQQGQELQQHQRGEVAMEPEATDQLVGRLPGVEAVMGTSPMTWRDIPPLAWQKRRSWLAEFRQQVVQADVVQLTVVAGALGPEIELAAGLAEQ